MLSVLGNSHQAFASVLLRIDPLSHRSNSAIVQPSLQAPSGIAQLRKSLDANSTSSQSQAQSMNLDDLIVPNSAASPAAISRSPSTETLTLTSHPQRSAALPIRKPHREAGNDALHTSRSSMPLSAHNRAAGDHTEFGYIQKRYRKTSMDERMVRLPIIVYHTDSV